MIAIIKWHPNNTKAPPEVKDLSQPLDQSEISNDSGITRRNKTTLRDIFRKTGKELRTNQKTLNDSSRACDNNLQASYKNNTSSL